MIESTTDKLAVFCWTRSLGGVYVSDGIYNLSFTGRHKDQGMQLLNM